MVQEAATRTVRALKAGISDVVGRKCGLIGDTKSSAVRFGNENRSTAVVVTEAGRVGTPARGTRRSNDTAGGGIWLGDTVEVDWSESDRESPRIPLYGTDSEGRYVEFEFDDVLIRPIINFDGSLGGVAFPTNEHEIRTLKLWGHAENRPGNRQFLPAWLASNVETRVERVAPEWYRDTEPEPVPYFDAETNDEPLVVIAHCSGNSYAIPYRDRESGEKRIVYVDGIVLGRLVEMSDDFRTACVQHPNSPLLQLSCSAGAVGGDAHLLFANYVHRQGFSGDVWAGRDTMHVNQLGEVGIRIQVAPDGTMVSPFSVIRAPENRVATPWSASTAE